MRRPRLIHERTARPRGRAPVPLRGWKPAALVWLKRARSSPLRVARPGTSVISISRSTRFDVHFSCPIFISSRATIAAPVVHAANAAPRQPNAHRISLLTLRRTHSTIARGYTVESARRDLVSVSRTVSERLSNEIHRVFRVNFIRPSPNSYAKRRRNRRTLSMHERVFDHLTRLTSVTRTGIGGVPYHFERAQLPFQAPIASSGPSSSAAAGTKRRHVVPELVWAAKSDAGTIERAERHIGSSTPTVLASAAPANFEQALDTAAVLRTQMLDPALMDRVAEDVIGRMERRMRIERERRGI